jgi:predicted porin
MNFKPTTLALALAFGACANAPAAESSEVDLLKQQMQALQKQLTVMQSRLDSITTANPSPTAGSQSTDTQSSRKGDSTQSPLTVTIGKAEATLYGFADLSFDSGRDGKQSVRQVSSNLSYLGVRGGRDFGSTGLRGIFQIETLANISGTPTETGGLASRNSFVGLQGSFGKLMLGKTDTPYKRATLKLDPFASSVGDYNAIMGNTGGDLRAEFDARIPHSIFYDSPNIGGFHINALVSPGQKFTNLANSDKYAFAQGEKVCSGATPGSSGSKPDPGSTLCNDGAFTTAVSLSLGYESGPLGGSISYERHSATDRTGDTNGVVSDESAAKIAVSYRIGGNHIAAIVEKFYRDGGIDPTVNERARTGYYVSDVQELGHDTDLMLAWAHAAKTPGGPDFGTLDDKANMYAVGLKHHFDKHASVYAVGALLKQGPGAHYALGAGGHGTAIASPRDDTGSTIPGQTISAVSVGMQYAF